jgi:tRNA pseudouridine38-40 synthase
MNANLPEDVAVKEVEIASEGFHPRYDAVSRCYQYQIRFAQERDPLKDRYAWHTWPPCELETLRSAARLLVGTRDFAAFGTPPRTGGSTIRTVFQAGWEVGKEGLWVFQVVANAFLYHMVRRFVFVQVLVGQQRLGLEELRQALDSAGPIPPGLAPPQGLALREVRFGSSGAGVRQGYHELGNT